MKLLPAQFRLDGLANAMASPRTTNRTVFVLFGGSLLFRVAVVESIWGHPQGWVMSFGICLATSALLMWVGSLTWQRWLVSTRPRIVASIALFAVISLITVPARELTAQEVSPRPLALIFRCLISFTSLVVFSYLLNESDRYRRAVNEFASEQLRLEDIRARTDAALIKVRTSLNELVASTVGPALQNCSTRIRDIWRAQFPLQALTSAATQIRNAATDVVRELSHSLDADPVVSTPLTPGIAGSASVRASVRMRDILEEATSARPFRPLVLSIIILLGSASVSVTARGLVVGLAAALLTSCVGFICLWLAARFLTGSLRKLSLAPRLAVVVVTLAAIGIVTFAIGSQVMSLAVRGLPALIVAYLVMSTLVAVGSALFELRRRHLAQLAQTLAEISLEGERLRDSELRVRRRVAQFLHGETQSRLATIAMQLDVLANQLDTVVSIDDPDVLLQLNACADALDESRSKLFGLAEAVDVESQVAVLDGLQLLTNRWRNICDIEYECPDSVAQQINAIPEVSAAVVECAKEAVSNAVRHGKARKVVIALAIINTHVEIRVINDGIAVRADYVPGLGMQTFLRAGTQVQLGAAERSSGMATQVVVRLPLPTAPR